MWKVTFPADKGEMINICRGNLMEPCRWSEKVDLLAAEVDKAHNSLKVEMAEFDDCLSVIQSKVDGAKRAVKKTVKKLAKLKLIFLGDVNGNPFVIEKA